MSLPKLGVVLGGGDWADASVKVLVLPSGLSLNDAREEYDKLGHYKELQKHFVDWLITSKGCVVATSNDIQEVWEYD